MTASSRSRSNGAVGASRHIIAASPHVPDPALIQITCPGNKGLAPAFWASERVRSQAGTSWADAAPQFRKEESTVGALACHRAGAFLGID
jgi:hypothetical protein